MGHTVPSAYAYVVSPALIHVTKMVDSLPFQLEGEKRQRDEPTNVKEDHFDIK